jgi:hypothetical protein
MHEQIWFLENRSKFIMQTDFLERLRTCHGRKLLYCEVKHSKVIGTYHHGPKIKVELIQGPFYFESAIISQLDLELHMQTL